VDRIGLRLQLRKRQAEAGDIVLLYGDESEALTHPYLARAWAKSGADLRVPAPGQAKKVAMLGSLDHVTRELIVHTSATKRSTDFVAHLEQLDDLYGPKPGRPAKPVVLVEDNGPIHVSKLSRAALAARSHWLTVEWLPKYAARSQSASPRASNLCRCRRPRPSHPHSRPRPQPRAHGRSVGQATNLCHENNRAMGVCRYVMRPCALGSRLTW
jgi:DDE superfamily endonuclease